MKDYFESAICMSLFVSTFFIANAMEMTDLSKGALFGLFLGLGLVSLYRKMIIKKISVKRI